MKSNYLILGRLIILLLIGIFLLIGHFTLATAQAESQRQGLSSDQAASAARSATGGKVLGVRGGKRDGGSYSVRVLLPDGRVRNLRVDAQTGKVSD